MNFKKANKYIKPAILREHSDDLSLDNYPQYLSDLSRALLHFFPTSFIETPVFEGDVYSGPGVYSNRAINYNVGFLWFERGWYPKYDPPALYCRNSCYQALSFNTYKW